MNARHDTQIDKNFDDLAHHFKNNIYGRIKGQIRLAVIERDLKSYLRGNMRITDAGGGQGQFALSLAQAGHAVSICDISAEMLALAKQTAESMDVQNVKYLHCSLQELPKRLDEPSDLLLCHAVLEWMAEPETALPILSSCLKPGGILSLAFFNKNSIIYKNLIRGNYRKVDSGNYVGLEGSLTPINPLDIDDVKSWCTLHGFEILISSGIRVFHDYIADQATRARAPEDAIRLELAFSQKEPFRSLGRYIHFVLRKQ